MTVLKIRVSSKVTDSKPELWTFKIQSSDFWPNLGGGTFWTGLLSADPVPIWEFSENFQIGTTQTRITPRPEAEDVCFWALGCSQIKNFLKIFNLGRPLARWYQIENFLKFFELVFKKEFKSPLAPGSRQPRHQIATWRPSGRLKGEVWGGDSPPRKKNSNSFLAVRALPGFGTRMSDRFWIH